MFLTSSTLCALLHQDTVTKDIITGLNPHMGLQMLFLIPDPSKICGALMPGIALEIKGLGVTKDFPLLTSPSHYEMLI